ncbi:serine/threonine-protein kinase [Streptomyces griseus]|uniref:serine/threonine-protein kinase n=2 Tax=Streptomyces griseus TaxID=1911 RepID=UPI00068F94CA|nr:serine/threonine-protein kinase [Streptomyces griseus]
MHGRILAGRYRLEELLGEGGMGQVWRGTDERLHRPVAVKVLAAPDDEHLAARLVAEARAAAAVSDAHAVAVHDVGETELEGRTSVFMVMELVHGRPLDEVLAEGPPSVADTVRWGRQICRALGAAHRAGVVHRDIKPSNVLVTGDDVKLCDFGIARRTQPSVPALTMTGMVVGTPGYMAPEQIRGDGAGPAADLYALGCLLYEVLAGRPPFTGEVLSVMARHLETTPRPVRELRPEAAGELDRLVADLMAKDPAARPADAAEVGRRLAGIRPRPSVPAPGPAPAPSVPTPTVAEPGGPDWPDAPTRTAPRRRPEPEREPERGREPEPERGREPSEPTAGTDAPAGTVKWGMGRTVWLAGALVTGALLLLTGMAVVWAVLIGLAATALLGFSYLGEDFGVGQGKEFEPPAVWALLVMMAVVIALAVILFVWTPAPWWVSLLLLMGGTPLLMGCSAVVRRAVNLWRRGPLQRDLASTSGFLTGVTASGITAAHTGTVVVIVAAGAATWLTAAVVMGALMPAHRTR